MNIICLSCGKVFKTEAEGIEHNEYWIKREQDTMELADRMRNTDLIERRHTVQFSGQQTVTFNA